jgi:putative transposase
MGRFKSFPAQKDDHLYAVVRYVERNALRANLAARAEAWRWGSLYRWRQGAAADKPRLASWPVPRKPSWMEYVNALQTETELAAIRRSIERGNPFGGEAWTERTLRALDLESTIRPRGRPRKQPD